jgi:alkyldihydroxyacetonephosphate synthase
MRRWNGWGEEKIDFPLPEEARLFLAERLGPASPLPDALFEDVLSAVPESRLPEHPLVNKTAEERLLHARGQSFPDWLALRSGNLKTFPDGIAHPSGTDQVRALLNFASDCHAAVIPYGGGTSVVGHINPQKAAHPVLSVDMRRMNRLLDLDRKSQIATFGAGASGPDVESQLRAHGYTLGHFPQSFEFSTLGGWIATRSSGQQSLGYGRIEQLFAGGRMETPSGTLEIRDFPASAAGPDLREMVLGSEGRLGILTEVKMRVSPLPGAESFRVLFTSTWDEGLTVLRKAVQAGIPLSMLRLSNASETETQLKLAGGKQARRLLEKWLSFRGISQQKCMVTLAITGSRPHHRSSLREVLRVFRQARAVHTGKILGRKWAQKRFLAPYLRNTLWERGYCVDTLETAVNWDRVDLTLQAVESALTSALANDGEKVLAFSHLSHLYPQGSSIYTTYLFRAGDTYDQTLSRWKRLKKGACDSIVQAGSTITHHHGVGLDHAPYLASEKGPLGVAAIRALCREFDPNGMMNPGKLIP